MIKGKNKTNGKDTLVDSNDYSVPFQRTIHCVTHLCSSPESSKTPHWNMSPSQHFCQNHYCSSLGVKVRNLNTYCSKSWRCVPEDGFCVNLEVRASGLDTHSTLICWGGGTAPTKASGQQCWRDGGLFCWVWPGPINSSIAQTLQLF